MLDHCGDILAIPFFAWLSYYFHIIPNRTREETILFIFSLGGLVADVAFTTNFIQVLHFKPIILILCYFIVVYSVHSIVFHGTFRPAPI